MSIKKHIIAKTFATVTLLIMGVLLLSIGTSEAAQVLNRSLTLSSPIASQSGVEYDFSFDLQNSYVLGSVVFEFCVEDPLPNEPCTSPPGFDSSLLNIDSQAGETGFAIHGNSTNNRIVLGRAPVATAATTLRYDLGSLTNPNANRTYYARIYTYASNDGTGANIDDGGIAFAINNAIDLDLEVPPHLLFCAATTISGLDCTNMNGNFIDIGEFSEFNTSTAESQFLLATNAGYGVSVIIKGNTLTSGNNIIQPLSVPTASRTGQSQFGINLRANTNPSVGSDPVGAGAANPAANYGTPNLFVFNGGDIVAVSPGTTDTRKMTVSYMVNVSADQRPGVYNTTLTYICLANF